MPPTYKTLRKAGFLEERREKGSTGRPVSEQLSPEKKLGKAEALIHSDQGVHYTLPAFQERVKETGLLQSMFRRGNCIDNAPMESFFGHFKNEVDFKLAPNLAALKKLVDNYMEHYNSIRKQWISKKMTPAAYRSHLIAALRSAASLFIKPSTL